MNNREHWIQNHHHHHHCFSFHSEQRTTKWSFSFSGSFNIQTNLYSCNYGPSYELNNEEWTNSFTKRNNVFYDSKWDYETEFQPRESFSFYHKNIFVSPVEFPERELMKKRTNNEQMWEKNSVNRVNLWTSHIFTGRLKHRLAKKLG